MFIPLKKMKYYLFDFRHSLGKFQNSVLLCMVLADNYNSNKEEKKIHDYMIAEFL